MTLNINAPRRACLIVGLGIAAAWAGLTALAGPLNPPAGVVTATAKPIAEIEPRIAINATNTPGGADSVFFIQQSGSYYLTDNIAVPSGKHGIKIDNINAPNVSIELNGFTISGVPGSLAGVKTTALPGGTSLLIRHGALRTLGGAGLDVYGQVLSVSDISAEFCGTGLLLGGNAVTINDCRSFFNTADGFVVSGTGVIAGCAAYLNSGSGYVLSGVMRLDRSVAANNTVKAASVSFGATIADCQLTGGSSEAVTLSGGATIERCTISVGAAIAIHATGTGNTIQDNSLIGGGTGATGVLCDSATNFVVRNHARNFATPYNTPAGTFTGALVNTGAGVATANGWANFAY